MPNCRLLRLFLFPLLLLGADQSPAQDNLAGSALQIVPADAAFFSSWSRLGEQFEIVRRSNTFQRLMDTPMIQQTYGPLLDPDMTTDDPGLLMTRQWLEQPAAKLALDALAHEVFMYGDASFTSMLQQFQLASAVRAKAKLSALAQGKTEEEAGKLAWQATFPIMSKIRVPSLTFGFKISDRDAAEAQLSNLDMMIKAYLSNDEIPATYRQRYQESKVHGRTFRTYRIDGSLLPLGAINIKQGSDPELVAKMMQTLRDLSVTVAFGMYEDYVIVSIGDSVRHLDSLGAGPCLIGHADLKTVRDHRDKRFTSIRYTAGQFRSQLRKPENTELARLNEYFTEVSQESGEVTESTRQKVKTALQAIQDDLGQDATAAVSAVIGYTLLTADGYQAFDYNNVSFKSASDSPMTILDHVGDAPIMVIAGFTGNNAEILKRWTSLVDTVAGSINFEGDEASATWLQIKAYFNKINDTIRTQLIPAFDNGQAAFVLSANDRSRQWHPEMPAAETPLLMPEVAVILEVTNHDRFIAGVDQVYRVAKEIVDSVIQMSDGELDPEQVALPSPVSSETPHGKIYTQPLWPDEIHLSANLVAPTAAIGDPWLVLAQKPADAAPLLTTGQFGEQFRKRQRGPRPQSVIYVNVASLGQVLREWVDYAEQIEPPDVELAEEDVAARAAFKATLELLGCWQSYQRVIYAQGQTSMTHRIWRFKDE